MVTRSIFALFFIVGTALSAAVTTAPAEEPGTELSRLAKIDSEQQIQAVTTEPGSAETPLPQWVDTLLTHLPKDEDTSELESQFEEAIGVNREATSPTEQPDDPAFPRPEPITPLYSSPKLDGEGVWTGEGAPTSKDGRPLLYKTVYRPSVDFPNSIVYMALFDMKRIKPRFFIGNTEPGVYEISNTHEDENLSKIVAITNAMWMQRHARGAGAIFRRREVYPMVDGMATLVVYKDDSADVLEWGPDIPRDLVQDARQLRYLIVKNGRVVQNVAKDGKIDDAEIGLGGFLVDNRGNSTMRKKLWFLANRTAFGVRKDGNLIFAMGHHVSTRDLARALVLAGCERAMHGDANIHNIVCNFYFRDEKDKIVKRDKLSPEQLKYTMRRYDQGYSKDFFAFYEK